MVVYRFDLSVMSLRGILLGLILLTMALTDLHGWIIPDRLQIAGCLVFLVTAFLLPEPVSRILHGLLFGTVLGGGMLFLSLLFFSGFCPTFLLGRLSADTLICIHIFIRGYDNIF